MVPNLQRITTEYSEVQDRIRVAGETKEGALTVLWLTQRLVTRLVPPLFDWLGHGFANEKFADIRQSFEQHAAVGALEPQAPVAPSADTAGWLVIAVDVNRAGQLLTMTFRSEQDHKVALPMMAVPLRQWLEILHAACLNAGWPMHCWPEWLREAGTRRASEQVVLH